MRRIEPFVELVEFRFLNCPGVIGMALCRVDGTEVEPLVVTIDDDGALLVSSKPVVWLEGSVGIDLGALFSGQCLCEFSRATRARLVSLARARATEEIGGDA